MFYRILLFLATLSFLLSCAAKTKNLASVPPPKNFPSQKDTLQVIDKIHFRTNLYLWQDFMPKMSEAGPPFYLTLDIKLKNNSKKKIRNFRVERLTLYYHESKRELNTFDLQGLNGDSLISEIHPQEMKELNFTNNRSQVFSPQLQKGEKFYARILVWWDGKKKIITSVPVPVEFTY